VADRRLHPNAQDPISEQHRKWGAACLATDIDLILLEYAPGGRPVAFVDYKLGLDRKLQDGEAKAMATIADLCSRAEIPGFAVKYGTAPWRFRVYPMTPLANGLYRHGRGELITERAYVRFLYELRGLELPAAVAEDLDDTTERAA
jgi:hypothetical protein